VETLVVDNYDSFTFNIVQYLEELGARVTVVRNDAMTARELAALRPRRGSQDSCPVATGRSRSSTLPRSSSSWRLLRGDEKVELLKLPQAAAALRAPAAHHRVHLDFHQHRGVDERRHAKH
jgi:hypothetical protein